jgi:hypothetical protein
MADVVVPVPPADTGNPVALVKVIDDVSPACLMMFDTDATEGMTVTVEPAANP